VVKVTVDMVNVLHEFGQQQFSIGNYAAASDLLYQFRILVSSLCFIIIFFLLFRTLILLLQSTDGEKTSQATWGKLACEILRTDWDATMEEVTKVKDLIEQKAHIVNYNRIARNDSLTNWHSSTTTLLPSSSTEHG